MEMDDIKKNELQTFLDGLRYALDTIKDSAREIEGKIIEIEDIINPKEEEF